MECTSAISVRSSYILLSKAEVLSGLSASFLEFYVARKGLGRPIVLTKMVHLLPRRKWIRCISLDAIPENDDNDGPGIGRSNLKSQYHLYVCKGDNYGVQFQKINQAHQTVMSSFAQAK